MGAFGSMIGGIMTIGSLFLGSWLVWTFTDKMFSLLWFVIFGILGGIALGSLNGRKARNQPKYKNEYTSYAGMAFAAIIFLGMYYAFFAIEKIEDKLLADSALTGIQTLLLAVASGILALFGVGLTVANSLADSR